MNDLIITGEMKDLKKALKDIEKEKGKEFDFIMSILLQRFGSKIKTMTQDKSDNDLFYRFNAVLSDGLIIELAVGKQ